MAQIKAAIKKLDEKIHKLDLKRTEKDELKTIALGTSKINYIDPRVTVAWCKRFNVPVEKAPPVIRLRASYALQPRRYSPSRCARSSPGRWRSTQTSSSKSERSHG
jgi:hypothetical protein